MHHHNAKENSGSPANFLVQANQDLGRGIHGEL
jgi:hypothetical protein